MSTNLVPVDVGTVEFELDQRRAKAYSESGYWPDAASVAKALVKIEAGRSMGLPPLIAMSEVHVIEGKPQVGAGAYAALVKAHPNYNYRVTILTNDVCELAFYERGVQVGVSSFSKTDAETAGLLSRKGPWQQYPRNMLFARAMSNGAAWFCPDVTMGRVYTGDELDSNAPVPDLPPDLVDDEIAFGEIDGVEEYELEREYLNNEEAEVVAALQDELDAEPDP